MRQAANGGDVETGQTTLDSKMPVNGNGTQLSLTSATNGGALGIDNANDDSNLNDNDDDDSGSADPSAQLEMEIRGRESIGSMAVADMVQRNGHANGNGHVGGEDVEMN